MIALWWIIRLCAADFGDFGDKPKVRWDISHCVEEVISPGAGPGQEQISKLEYKILNLRSQIISCDESSNLIFQIRNFKWINLSNQI